MSNKKLSLLGILAAVSVILAVLAGRFSSTATRTSSPQGGNLIQGLNPAAISKIVVGKGDEQVVLKRSGNHFVVANKNFYTANNRIINDLLAACLDVRIVELYTEDKVNHKDLGVTEEDARDMVRFFDANGALITGIIVGNSREDGTMAYARLANEDKVYIIYNTPWIRTSPLDYIETEILSVNKADINSVTVTSPNETYTLTVEPNTLDVVLTQLPAGKKQKNRECSAVFNALSSLRFDDVNSAEEMKDLNFDRKYECLLNDSTLYTIQIAQKDSTTFIKCRADFTDRTPVRKEDEVESQEQLKKKEAKLLARERAKKFTDSCQAWIYQIPEYKARNLTRPLSELLEDITSEPNSSTSAARSKK